MPFLTAHEQYMLELINRARLDPAAEAARLGIDLNEGLTAGTISATAKQALAANFDINGAADGHSQWMIDTDQFSHTGNGGSTPQSRMTASGYTFTGSWGYGENIGWNGTTGTLNQTTSTLTGHNNLFIDAGYAGRGHRINILTANFREVGLGIVFGQYTSSSSGVTYNANMATQDFAYSNNRYFITGVAYTDSNNDQLYSVGEAQSVTVTIINQDTEDDSTFDNEAAGGYASLANNGNNYVVSFTGGNLTQAVTVYDVAINNANAKIDLIGTDTIATSVSLALSNGSNARQAIALGIGAINLTGNDLNNTLVGGTGNNVLDGGDGADTMSGGKGDDSYVIDNAADVVTELANQGTDTVQTTISYALGANLENLTLIGGSAINGTGNSVANWIAGNDAANFINADSGNDVVYAGDGHDYVLGGDGDDQLYGQAGNDTLAGKTGADFLSGGAGDDTYILEDSNDTIYEDWGAGIDTVQAWVNNQLGDQLENLALMGSTEAGSGNALNNWLTGNDAANWMDGGDGHDAIYGYGGDDTLLGGWGDDVLDAGDGNDTLNGGYGVDTLRGGAGNDIYVVDGPGDNIVESADGGVDTVYSTGHFTLSGNLENLLMTGAQSVNGTGDAGSNWIYGNSGNNSLAGAAGADAIDGSTGNDTLDGGSGNDLLSDSSGNETYLFHRGYDIDRITDTAGSDTLAFSDTNTAITANQLWFSRWSDDLIISVHGGTAQDQVSISNWFASSANQIEQITAQNAGGSKVLNAAQVQNLVNALATQAAPALGATLTSAQQSALDAAVAAYWAVMV